MDNLIGRKLDGRYEIIQQVGSGGMANVYKAIDAVDGKTVAVKVLRDEFVNNEEFLRRFKNESKAIAMLDHPNIVKVFDVNFSEATQYIVMEYIDGITLMRYLEHKKKLGWKDALHFTVQVLRALQHAHDRGIVHRDIKPQNIMLLKDGTIKVMDFGIARFSQSQTRTITDKAIGSVHYISPEQAKGSETDAKSDIYSLGVMLYEMLTGTLPFESDSAVSVAIQQISQNPKSLREIDPSIPEALEDITLKAMAKEPADRYSSAAQMLKDIDEFKANPSIRFEYKYLNTESSRTRYSDVVESNKPDAQVAKQTRTEKNTKTKSTKSKKEEKDGGAQTHRKKNIFIPILIGVTIACLIGALIMVYLTFASGEDSIFNKHKDMDLPNFVGLTLEEVKNNPEYSGFEFVIEEEYDTNIEAGYIIDQDPLPPRQVKDNIVVTLYVSLGKEYVFVPDLKGVSSSEAFQTLTDLHLVIMVESVSTTEVGENEVLRTNPQANTEVEAWSVVTLYVRSPEGVYSCYVPDVIGKLLGDAKTVLQTNGLRVGEVTEEWNEEIEKGRVISQSVEPDKQVYQKSEIDLVVSKGPFPTDLSVKIVGYGSYSFTFTIDEESFGSQTGWVVKNGSGMAIITVTITNGTETVAPQFTFDYRSGSVEVNVAESIPAEWSDSGEDPGGDTPGGEDPGGETPPI